MPRPPKEGLEFWCLDVDAYDDEKLIKLVMKAGHEGVAIWHYLMASIYRVGMCYRWGLGEAEALAFKRNLDLSLLQKSVSVMVDVGLFDRTVLEEHGYLTSKAIQKRFRAACSRRVPKELPEGVDLLSPPSTPSNTNTENKNKNKNRRRISEAAITPLFVAETPVNVAETRVIAAETRVIAAETKKEEKKAPGWRPDTYEYGTYFRVFLTLDEYEEFVREYGESYVKSKITHLDAQIENGMKKYVQYKNHAACIRNWCETDRASGRLPVNKKSTFEKNLETVQFFRDQEEKERHGN